jgi:hypothetical protein
MGVLMAEPLQYLDTPPLYGGQTFSCREDGLCWVMKHLLRHGVLTDVAKKFAFPLAVFDLAQICLCLNR